MDLNLDFYKGKKVLITGHTGFKGTWLSKILLTAGADVTGYALEPETNPSLFNTIKLGEKMNSIIGDIRDYEKLQKVFDEVQPEIVFHLAAQPIVRTSYEKPRYTYETNVMGTVNVLECIRNCESVKSFLNVTTDKVYKNNEWRWGYRENEELNGYDPYSNSKSCSELVTQTYKRSFFSERKIAISTARAGNVIGGGDFAKDRIIPDCVRAALKNEKIIIRNPNSVRPFEHVLEPLFAYLMIAQKQYEDLSYADSYNVGPDEENCVSAGTVAKLFVQKWGNGLEFECKNLGGPHEANFLKLDCTKIKSKFGWEPRWNIDETIDKTVRFSKLDMNEYTLIPEMEKEINEYIGGSNLWKTMRRN